VNWTDEELRLRERFTAYQHGTDLDGARLSDADRALADAVIAYACQGLPTGDERARRAHEIRTDPYTALPWAYSLGYERGKEQTDDIWRATLISGAVFAMFALIIVRVLVFR
jgi:hypothetical protein